MDITRCNKSSFAPQGCFQVREGFSEIPMEIE